MNSVMFAEMTPKIREFLLLAATDYDWACRMGCDFMQYKDTIHAIMHNQDAAMAIWSDLIKENPAKMKYCMPSHLIDAVRNGMSESRIFGMRAGYFMFCKVLYLNIHH